MWCESLRGDVLWPRSRFSIAPQLTRMRSLIGWVVTCLSWMSLSKLWRFCTQNKPLLTMAAFNTCSRMTSLATFPIGAHGAAERLEKAVAMFPFESPHLHQEKRLEFMEALGEQSEFVELGDEVCGDEKVWTALEEYAKTNAASFPVRVN
jgi:hypothetical protein